MTTPGITNLVAVDGLIAVALLVGLIISWGLLNRIERLEQKLRDLDAK